MLARRIIPCLDVDRGRVVKGVKFVDLEDAGDPVEAAGSDDDEGADELVFLDIGASHEGCEIQKRIVERVADRLSIPFTVGGGIRTAEDMRDILRAGADEVAVNTAAVEDPAILSNGARRFGRQSVVLAIDARRRGHGTIVGINGSMVNGTSVIRPSRGEAPSIPPWDSADFPHRTARISGRTASSNCRPAWPDAGLRPDQGSGRTRPRPTARRSHGQHTRRVPRNRSPSHATPNVRYRTRHAAPRTRHSAP